MIVIPAMDILDGRVVRLRQGDYTRISEYASDPLSVAAELADAGFQKLHLVDLSGARAGQPAALDLFAQIRQRTGCAVEFGGGIRLLSDVRRAFDLGLDPATDSAMIGSLPFKNPGEFAQIVSEFAASVLLTVDVHGRDIRISGWQADTSVTIHEFIPRMKAMGLSRFLVTQILRDGMLNGPDLELYQELGELQVEVTASGGVSSVDDLVALAQIGGVEAAILGKAWYENRVTLPELREAGFLY